MLFNFDVVLIEQSQNADCRKFRFLHRIVLRIDFIVISGRKICCSQLRFVENRVLEIAMIKNRLRQIGTDKGHFFQGTRNKFRLWHFLIRKRSVIERAVRKINLKQEVGATLKLYAEQLTVFKRNLLQTCIRDLHHRQVAVDKPAFHKRIVRKIAIRKITVRKHTTFKFPILNFGGNRDDFIKGFVNVN